MKFFKKNRQPEVVAKQEKCHSLKAAKSISDKYAELKYCCSVLSSINEIENPDGLSRLPGLHSRGWRLWADTITSAGIDIEEVYSFIGDLAKKRKSVIECELAQLDYNNSA